MNAVFVDTGAFVARVLPSDQYHQASGRGWQTLENVEVRLYSSEHVLDESVSLLIRQAGAAYAARWARDHLASEQIVWLNTSREDWHEALRWLEKFSDQKVSFTDCLSFSLMRREAIASVFGFDHHFVLAGYELWPRL
jgi:hypothetical protein